MDPLQQAVHAALYGPEKKGISLYRHGFNVHRAFLAARGAETIITGQLSHRLSGRRDDQIYYTVIKEGCAIKSVTKYTDRGGWTPIVAPLVSVVGTVVFGVVIPIDQLVTAGQALGRLYDGSWESCADILVLNIALHAAR